LVVDAFFVYQPGFLTERQRKYTYSVLLRKDLIIISSNLETIKDMDSTHYVVYSLGIKFSCY
jgi:hypothetical protein